MAKAVNEEMLGYKVVTYQPQRLVMPSATTRAKRPLWVDICARVDKLLQARSIARMDKLKNGMETRVMVATDTRTWEEAPDE